ncbi:MAG: hypothetical protein H0T62_09875 [Parachlamydiaceae bacterium]|nr:hypothetical protein [Parachlamydiaceae bacterium]
MIPIFTGCIFPSLQPGYILEANEKIAKSKQRLLDLPPSEEAPLVLNSLDRYDLPRHFRESTNSMIIPTSRQTPENSDLPNLEGLAFLHVSASAQPAVQEFRALTAHYQGIYEEITIVNLREESCIFINGDAISAFAATNLGNMGKSLKQIINGENDIISYARGSEKLPVYKIISKTPLDTLDERVPIEMLVDKVYTEQEVVKSEGLSYVRIPMTDHMRPNDSAVDAFVVKFSQRKPDTHLHFHCWEGHGRTTTVMIMIDSMQNAGNVSFKDICKRQWWLGGEGSNMSNVPKKPSYKHELFDERFQFLSTFYQYCLENRESGFQKSWTQYLQINGIHNF